MNYKLYLIGLRKVTDDMKTKNRTDKTGIVGISEKESRAGSHAVSKVGPPKLELQMGRKYVYMCICALVAMMCIKLNVNNGTILSP